MMSPDYNSLSFLSTHEELVALARAIARVFDIPFALMGVIDDNAAITQQQEEEE